MVGLIYTNQHHRAAAIGPILKDDLLLQTVLLLDWLVDLIIHILIILDGLQIVDVETSGLFTVGNSADVTVTLLDFLSDVDAIGTYFIEFLEIWVVFIEDAPEL